MRKKKLNTQSTPEDGTIEVREMFGTDWYVIVSKTYKDGLLVKEEFVRANEQ